MATIQELVTELEQEAQLSRRTLERVPDDRLAWRPNEKSMRRRDRRSVTR